MEMIANMGGGHQFWWGVAVRGGPPRWETQIFVNQTKMLITNTILKKLLSEISE